MSPRKRTSGLPKRPQAVRKAPTSPSEPSIQGQATPVAPYDFDALCGQLTPLEKDKARWAADQKGVSLPNLLRLYPDYRHQEAP